MNFIVAFHALVPGLQLVDARWTRRWQCFEGPRPLPAAWCSDWQGGCPPREPCPVQSAAWSPRHATLPHLQGLTLGLEARLPVCAPMHVCMSENENVELDVSNGLCVYVQFRRETAHPSAWLGFAGCDSVLAGSHSAHETLCLDVTAAHMMHAVR